MNIQTERRRNVTIAILILALIIILGSLSGCHSKSGKLTAIKPEKVVIIDSVPRQFIIGSGYQYKVNRFEKGVVDIIWDYKLLEKGDTIFHKFPN